MKKSHDSGKTETYSKKITHHRALGFVGSNDGLRVLVEGDEPLLDGLHVVVRAPGGLSPLEQPLSHGLVGDLEVEDVLARGNGLLELLALSHLARVPVDQEALGPAQLLDHGLGQEVQHSGLLVG